MTLINGLLRPVFDTALMPFQNMHPLVGLTVLAIPITAGMLWVFKIASSQKRLAAIKDRIHAGLFEIRLFRDDLRAIFRAQGEILLANLKYLGLILIPLVILMIPFVFIVGQMQFHYGYEGLEPGESTVVKVQLRDGWENAGFTGENGRPHVTLDVPSGLRVDTPPVWIAAHNELAWRVTVLEPGDYEVKIRAGTDTFVKAVDATSRRVARRSPLRVSPGFLDELIYPAEPPLPNEGAVRQIGVAYEASGPMWFEISHWIWIFVGITIVMAFFLRKPLGVTI